MVSSQSFTELQLLKSGIALSISGGLFKLWPGERQMATDRRVEMNRETKRLVGGSLKMRKESKASKRQSDEGERGALKRAPG